MGYGRVSSIVIEYFPRGYVANQERRLCVVDLSNIVRFPRAVFDRMTGDSFRNFLAGFGVPGRDKSLGQQWWLCPLDNGQLEAAYRGDWAARKIIDIPAFDMTRAWRQWQADKEQVSALEDTERMFDIPGKMLLALKMARLYGGAAMVMGVDQGTFQDELDLDAIREGDLKFVHVVSKNFIAAGPPVREITSAWFGEPTYYQRSNTVTVDPPDSRIANVGLPTMGQAPGDMLMIHPSRVIRLVGAQYPDIENAPDAWGDSVLQVVQDALKAAGMASSSIATLISEAKLDIFKVPNLTAKMMTEIGTQELFNRFAQGNIGKSTINALLVDMAEEFERITPQLSNYDKVISIYYMLACAAADIPATRFMGKSPDGMNATGESDLRNYYDRLSSDQKVKYTPLLTRLDEVLIRHTFGERDDSIRYEWNPLWQLSATEKADMNLKAAQAHQIDVGSGIISPHVLQTGRQNFLMEDGFLYPGIEQAIDDEADWDAEEGMQLGMSGGMLDPNDPQVVEHKAKMGKQYAPDPPPKQIGPPKGNGGGGARDSRRPFAADSSARAPRVSSLTGTAGSRSRFFGDEERESDPTGTGPVRARFRADAAMRLRQVRAQMRRLVVEHDVLALGQSGPMAFHPANTRLDAFGHSLHVAMMGVTTGDWTRVFLHRAWQDGVAAAASETGVAAVHNDDEFEGLVTLAKRELDGIGAAIQQRLVRVADGIIAASAHQTITPIRAFNQLDVELGKVADQRLPLLADTAPVLAFTRALISVYRSHGIGAVGVVPESGAAASASPRDAPRSRRRVRDDIEPDDPNVVEAMERFEELQQAAIPKSMARVGFVGVRTAGDEFVCQICEDLADAAPYTLAEYIGQFPAHPRCRCRPFPWLDQRYAKEDSAPRARMVVDWRWWADAPPQPEYEEGKHPRAAGGRWTNKPASDPYWKRQREAAEARRAAAYKTGLAVEAEAQRVAAAAAASSQPKPAQKELFPGVFPPIPGEKVSLPDFDKGKVEIGNDIKGDPGKLKKFLDLWGERVKEAPEQFRQEFLGGTPGTMVIQEEDRSSWNISGKLENADGITIGEYTRTIDFETNKASSDYFKLYNSSQGKDVGKQLLAGNVAMYQKMGLDAVEVHADIDVGGYAWAKYGYVPTERSWQNDLNVWMTEKLDELGGGRSGYEPESWDEIGDDEQERIFRAWADYTEQDFIDSESESWRDSGQDLAVAKTQLADEKDVYVWASKGMLGHALVIGEGEDVKSPSVGQYLISKGTSLEHVLHNTTITYDDRRGDGEEDPDVTIEPEQTKELTDDERSQLEDMVKEVFNKEAENRRGDLDPTDYISENITEYQREYWDSMRARDKFAWARDNGELPQIGEAEGSGEIDEGDASTLRELIDDSDPKAVWAIADSEHGKELLLGSDWYGELDLHDEETMKRFNAYVGKAKRAEAKPAG
jgi:hypothetical protein